MIRKETKTTAQDIKTNLIAINDSINEYLNILVRDSTSLNQTDREVIRTIRNKNIETIQLIHEMEYKEMI